MTLGHLRSTKRTRRTLRPELVMAPGPAVMGQPGAGSLGELYGDRWALAWGKTAPTLLHEQGGAWVEVTPGAPWPALEGAAHLSLAFDQSAHHVLTWSTAAGLYVRQWDTSTRAYVYLGPFAGVDPVLMADAPLSGDVAGSDVVLWHLTPDRAALVYRLQRDYYRTVYPAATLEAGAVLDQVAGLPLRAELLGELPSGAPWSVLTGLYPLTVRELARGAARPAAGSYLPAVGAASGAELPAFGAAAPGGGRYQAVVVTSRGAEPPAFGAASPRPGRYALGLLRYAPPAEPPVYGAAMPGAGRYGK